MGKIILFQGDSITDVGRARDCDLPNVGMGAGYPFMVMSALRCAYPEKDFQCYNRGISGNRIVDLYARWKLDALNLKPDILSILIGVNDTWHESARHNGVDVKRYGIFYKMLLEWTLETLPDVKLLLMDPFVLPFDQCKPGWPEEIAQRREIVHQLAAEFKTANLKTQDLLDEAVKKAPHCYWLRDGVHPTSAGHQLITNAWLKAAQKLI